MDTGIAHHGGRKGKAERNTTGTGFGGSFPFWRVLRDLKHIRQMLRMETILKKINSESYLGIHLLIVQLL